MPRWERFYVFDEKKNRPVAVLDCHERMHWMPENELIFRIASIVEWLTLNHGMLDIFLHPNTGDACAIIATPPCGSVTHIR